MAKGTVKQNVVALAYNKRGRLLAVGQNSYIKTHPLQKKYAETTDNPHKIYLHAELDALIKAKSFGGTYRLVIIRTSPSGNRLCAKPCECCRNAIKDFGVTVVEHS